MITGPAVEGVVLPGGGLVGNKTCIGVLTRMLTTTLLRLSLLSYKRKIKNVNL